MKKGISSIKKKLFMLGCTVVILICMISVLNKISEINLVDDVISNIVKSTETKVKVEDESKTNIDYSFESKQVQGSQYENNRGIITEFTEEEFAMYVAIIFCEVGAEPYEGKLAVANVILNRLYSARYPNTLKEVLYQKSQFSPAGCGLLDKRIAEYNAGGFTTQNHKECIEAAKEAMAGHNNIGTQIGFLSPELLEEYFGGKYTDKIVISKVAFFNV